MLILLIALAGALHTAPQPHQPVQTEAVQDWTGVSETLLELASEFEVLATAMPSSGGGEAAMVLGDQLEIRALCNADQKDFALALLARRCPGNECQGDATELARRAALAAGVAMERLLAEDQPDLFLPSGARFENGPANKEEALLFGAAADLRLRTWTDGLLASAPQEGSDTQAMLLFAWCRLTRTNRTAALDWVRDNGFPSDGDPQQRRLVPAMIYVIQHSATHYAAVSTLRNAAEKRFVSGELSPYFFAQILDVERSAFDSRQVVGSLTSCEGENAIFDPPLVDEEEADRTRRAYGLSSSDRYLESVSRRCRF